MLQLCYTFTAGVAFSEKIVYTDIRSSTDLRFGRSLRSFDNSRVWGLLF